MTLPLTIVSTAGLMGYHPPWKSSGDAFYFVVRAGVDELDVYKATDPTDSATVQDSGNGPVHVGTLLGFTTFQDGDIIHIIAWSSATYEYYTFNMATDAWVIDELMETPTNAPDQPWASISVRSITGVPVVEYAGDTDRVMGGAKERVDVAHRDGGTWTVGISLDIGGDFHYGNPNMVKGPLTDDMHLTWQRTTNTADPPTAWEGAEGRTLDPSNNLSLRVATGLDTAGALLGVSHGISYDDTLPDPFQRLLYTGIQETSGRPRLYYIAIEDGSDDISFGGGLTDTAGADGYINGEVGITTIAELDETLHQLYSGGGTDGVDQDIYYTTSIDNEVSLDLTWAVPVEELDGVTCNFISATVYVRDLDTVLAYVYDDGGVQKYNEKILITGQTHRMML